MRNLAGNIEADKHIAHELIKAGISIIEAGDHNSEVPYTLCGQVGSIRLHRAWTYWVAEGLVPLETANKLWNNPVGYASVRVAGHCGCPPPERPWTTRIHDIEYVDLYHIDDEDGLRLFADTIKGLL